MSLWFWGRKTEGRRAIYSVSMPLLMMVAVIGMILALLLPLLQSLRK